MIISGRRASERQEHDPGYDPDMDPSTGLPIEGEYKNGYGPTSREVLIPSFYAAYTKTDPEKVDYGHFPFSIQDDAKLENHIRRIVEDWFHKGSLQVGQSYSSVQKLFTRSVHIHQTLIIMYLMGGVNNIRDLQNNFIQPYQINTVTVSEQFSPLINIDMNWKSNLTSRFEWRKSRTVSLNLTGNQVTDNRINDLVFGAGYRFDDVQIIIKTGGGQRLLKAI